MFVLLHSECTLINHKIERGNENIGLGKSNVVYKQHEAACLYQHICFHFCLCWLWCYDSRGTEEFTLRGHRAPLCGISLGQWPRLRNPRGFSAVCLQCSCLYSALHSHFFFLCLLSEEVHWRLNVFWMEDLKETFNPWRPCKHLIFITPSAHGCRGPFPRDEGAAEIGGLLDVTNTFVSSVLAFPWFKFFPSFWVKEFPICNQDNILGYFQHCTWVRAPGHLISLLCILLCSIFKI